MNPQGKRNAILSVAERLFAEHGYGGTSIADIAKAADVAVGSVYRLFPDKPSLLAALHQRMEQRFIDAMTTAWDSVEGYSEKFEPLIAALLREAEIAHEFMPLYTLTKDMIGTQDYVPGALMIEAIEDLYGQGVDAGVYRPVRAGILGPLAHAMVEGGMRAWMMKPTRATRNRVQSELAEVFERAFLA
ncbi:MAG: TetR/AcrR family transcriptional regulator [Pseudomonadota bacterium]